MNKNVVCEKVAKFAKEERGWSLYKLGTEMGIDNNIYRILNRNPISISFLMDVCRVLSLNGIDAADLFHVAGYCPFSEYGDIRKFFVENYFYNRYRE